MSSHNKRIFVRPKKVCLFCEKTFRELFLFGEQVLLVRSGGFRILGRVYTVDKKGVLIMRKVLILSALMSVLIMRRHSNWKFWKFRIEYRIFFLLSVIVLLLIDLSSDGVKSLKVIAKLVDFDWKIYGGSYIQIRFGFE